MQPHPQNFEKEDLLRLLEEAHRIVLKEVNGRIPLEEMSRLNELKHVASALEQAKDWIKK
jgi:hypothetical protein